MALHIIKLCVGCDTVEELMDWRREQGEGQPWILRTRMTPKRVEEVLDGGSLYRVFKGFILCRQRILSVDTVGAGQAARCEITLDQKLVLVAPTPRRAFQGWRYLDPREAPEDLKDLDEGGAPPELAKQLRELGAW
jgi:hypothetical protein